jgi:hypothetical protein
MLKFEVWACVHDGGPTLAERGFDIHLWAQLPEDAGMPVAEVPSQGSIAMSGQEQAPSRPIIRGEGKTAGADNEIRFGVAWKRSRHQGDGDDQLT